MKTQSVISSLAFSILLGASQLAHAYLPGSVSGPFYNPEQSGHGINIDIVDDQRAIAIWHVYDTEGNPLTLYIDGAIEGRRIVGQAYAPEGMQFGDFNPNDVQLPHWGNVDIDFESCDQATLSWVADDLAYGDGEMVIRRLVQPVGVECRLSSGQSAYVGPGIYQALPRNGVPYVIQGVRDEHSAFWGIERKFGVDGEPIGSIPSALSEQSSDQAIPNTIHVSHRPTNPPFADLSEFTSPLTWLRGVPSMRISRSWTYWNIVGLESVIFPGSGEPLYQDQATSELVTSLNAADLVGTYSVPFRDGQGEMTISEDGSICMSVPGIDATCAGSGAVSVSYPGLGMVDFRLTVTGEYRSGTYFGRGWMADAHYGRELVLIGHPDSEMGFGLVAIKQP